MENLQMIFIMLVHLHQEEIFFTSFFPAIQSCYPDPCENGATCVTASNGESYCL